MTSTVILNVSALVFWCFFLFFFCNFFRDLSSFTDTMAAEGICERKNTYWLGTVHFLWSRGGWWDLEECNLKIVRPPPISDFFRIAPPPLIRVIFWKPPSPPMN